MGFPIRRTKALKQRFLALGVGLIGLSSLTLVWNVAQRSLNDAKVLSSVADDRTTGFNRLDGPTRNDGRLNNSGSSGRTQYLEADSTSVSGDTSAVHGPQDHGSDVESFPTEDHRSNNPITTTTTTNLTTDDVTQSSPATSKTPPSGQTPQHNLSPDLTVKQNSNADMSSTGLLPPSVGALGNSTRSSTPVMGPAKSKNETQDSPAKFPGPEKDSWDYKMPAVVKDEDGKTVMGLYDVFGDGVDKVRLLLVMTSCCMAPKMVVDKLKSVDLVNDSNGSRSRCHVEQNPVFNRTEMDKVTFKSEIYMSLVLFLNCEQVIFTRSPEQFSLHVDSEKIPLLDIVVSPHVWRPPTYSAAIVTVYKPGYVNRGPDFEKNKVYHDYAGNVRLPEWIAYHLAVGFEHVYVGVDGTQKEVDTIRLAYKKATDQNKLTIFRHYSGVNTPDSQRQVLGFYGYSNRQSESFWSLHCDMDEYFVTPNGTLAEFITQIPADSCSTWLRWEDFNRPVRSLQTPIDSKHLVLEQSNYRKEGVVSRGFREGKSMMKQSSVVYYGLHRVTAYAKPECREFTANHTKAFLAHLRVVPRFRSLDPKRQILDTNLSARATQVRGIIEELNLFPHEL